MTCVQVLFEDGKIMEFRMRQVGDDTKAAAGSVPLPIRWFCS